MSDIQEINQRLDGIESHLHTLTNNQQYMIRMLNRMTKTGKSNNSRKAPTQKSNTKQNTRPTSSDVSKLLHLPEALQRNIHNFTDNVLFNPTAIPDELISAECLSEDECQVISSKSSSKDQTRLLVRKIKARGPVVIEKFLEIIGKDHPHLPEKVYESLEVIEKENKQKPKCVICIMQLCVDLKDIADYLWGSKIISDEVYEDICDCEHMHKNKQLLWRNVIHAINHYENPKEAIDILLQALKSKYNHIVQYLEGVSERPTLSCCCCVRRRVRQRPQEFDQASQTEGSTTSAILPKTVYGHETSEEYSSLASSQDLPSGLSFEILDRFDSIESSKPPVQSKEIQCHDISSSTRDISETKNYKSRHSSGNFDPRNAAAETIDTDKDEHNASIPLFGTEFSSNDGHKPEYKQSISMQSNTTIICKQSSGSGEAAEANYSTDESPTKRLSICTDAAVSPDVNIDDVKLQFPNKSNIDAEESTKETDVEDLSSQTMFERQKAYRRRRHKSTNDADDADVEDHADSHCHSNFEQRARHRRYQRKMFLRQRSIPHEDITLITEPRKGQEKTAPKIGVRRHDPRKSKKSLQRQLRRQRSSGETINTSGVGINVPPQSDDVTPDKGLKKPFNPLLGQGYLHPKLTPKWDYNQAMRYRKMSQLSVNAERVKSDTDLRADDVSDTMTFSDFTA